MDTLTKWMQKIGVPVFEKQTGSPGTQSTEPQLEPDVIPDPTDFDVLPTSLAMVRGNQPTNLLALSNENIAPSFNNGAELKISDRFSTRPRAKKIFMSMSSAKVDSSVVVDDGNKQRLLSDRVAPPTQEAPFGNYYTAFESDY